VTKVVLIGEKPEGRKSGGTFSLIKQSIKLNNMNASQNMCKIVYTKGILMLNSIFKTKHFKC
jgi:hypothetical protein